MIDADATLDMANEFIELEMYPFFDIAHSVLCALQVRDDLGESAAKLFSREHPMSCWLYTMMVIFAGGMLCNGLLGEPILEPLKNTPQVTVCTVAWYVVFYSPFDIGYKMAKYPLINIVFATMKEIYRCRKVYDGVSHAGKLYPNSYIIMVVIGTLRGNGAGFTRFLERLIRGAWTPNEMEFMKPSLPTKASLMASIVFVLDKKTDLVSASHAQVYFGVAAFFVYFKLMFMLVGIHDPFVPIENLVCTLFFKGSERLSGHDLQE